ncbi:hypothetical protein QN416_23995, partial [Glaciimonas sp. Cout2]|uniref:hypothetical protein n=1 Tax=Glaciimonas sp. Cout2 TaxID=3048621 RepID=UPI002B22847F
PEPLRRSSAERQLAILVGTRPCLKSENGPIPTASLTVPGATDRHRDKSKTDRNQDPRIGTC